MSTKPCELLLTGDIGGTSTRLALYEEAYGKITQKEFKVVPSKDFPNLSAAIKHFLDQVGCRKIDAACVGVPGPVIRRTVNLTNLPWTITELEIASSFAISRVKLINDLETVAAALPELEYRSANGETVLKTLHVGTPERNYHMRAVVAPGTGLGQALLFTPSNLTDQKLDSLGGYCVNSNYVTIGTEGGHVNFAPTTELEWELFQFLMKFLNRVSVERICAGPGIVNVYNFLISKINNCSDSDKNSEQVCTLKDPLSPDAAAITQRALAKDCPVCVQTMNIFARVLGSHAGNVVLTTGATGGVYLGGGIPPKILPILESSEIITAYTTKGRLSPLVKSTPLKVILDDMTGLRGAALIAARLS